MSTKMIDATYAPPSKAPEIKEAVPYAGITEGSPWGLFLGLGAIGLGLFLMRRAIARSQAGA